MVLFLPVTNVSLGEDTSICEGSLLHLNPGISSGNFLWSDSSTSSFVITGSGGDWWVQVTDSNNCTASDTITVIFLPSIAMILGLDSVYCSSDLPVSLIGLPANGQFSGSGMNGNLFLPNQAALSVPIFISYTYTDSLGCVFSDSQMTLVGEPVMADAGPDQQVPLGNATQLEGNVPPSGGAGYWTAVSGPAPESGADPDSWVFGLVEVANLYEWTLVQGSCSSTDLVVINREPFKVERGFSPDGDGLNDAFVIPGLERYPNSKLQVLTRWGAMIFESEDYHNEWKGLNRQGQELPNGTYYYVLGLNNGTKINGFVVLRR